MQLQSKPHSTFEKTFNSHPYLKVLSKMCGGAVISDYIANGGATLVERGAAAPDKTKYLSKSLSN